MCLLIGWHLETYLYSVYRNLSMLTYWSRMLCVYIGKVMFISIICKYPNTYMNMVPRLYHALLVYTLKAHLSPQIIHLHKKFKQGIASFLDSSIYIHFADALIQSDQINSDNTAHSGAVGVIEVFNSRMDAR